MGRDVASSRQKSDGFLWFQVQSGQRPAVSEILAVRGLFSGPPLGMKGMGVDHMVSKNPPPHKQGPSAAAVMFLCPNAEKHQPSALPDAPPPGFPDWPAAEQPRTGAAPVGPGPGQTWPPSVD